MTKRLMFYFIIISGVVHHLVYEANYEGYRNNNNNCVYKFDF